MKVEYAFIAEAADAANGLFYVLRGGTDIWYVLPEVTFPTTVGPMSFVVRLIGGPEEVGRSLAVNFTIVDPDGRSLGVEGAGEIEFSEHPLDRTRANGALIHFRIPVPVPAPGAYFFELHSPEVRLCQVPFWVLVTSESPQD